MLSISLISLVTKDIKEKACLEISKNSIEAKYGLIITNWFDSLNDFSSTGISGNLSGYSTVYEPWTNYPDLVGEKGWRGSFVKTSKERYDYPQIHII